MSQRVRESFQSIIPVNLLDNSDEDEYTIGDVENAALLIYGQFMASLQGDMSFVEERLEGVVSVFSALVMHYLPDYRREYGNNDANQNTEELSP